MKEYDLVVIGSGPAGQKAAIQAAKLGRRVGVVERRECIGGVCLHSGTIPSKTLREAILAVTARRNTDPEELAVKSITIAEVICETARVSRAEVSVLHDQFRRNGIDVLQGEAAFDDPQTVKIDHGSVTSLVRAKHIVVACGTEPARHADLPYNDADVIDSDGLLKLPDLPQSMIIVGGGVIGTEYTCMLAALGVAVTLVEGKPQLLEFADREIVESLQFHMRKCGVELRLGETVRKVEIHESCRSAHLQRGLIHAWLESGKHLSANALMYCVGRQGSTARLGLERAGLTADDRGRIPVNEHFQTSVPNIYAVGDVIGFPSLASTSMEQGRRAACHLCGVPAKNASSELPLGIFGIPEISMVGKTEEALTKSQIPYEVGLGHYREVARGQILRDEDGLLKLIIDQRTRLVLGVHIIGTGATELIHIGQAVIALGGTLDYFLDTVFNYPTLAEAYKVAALNAANKLLAIER